VSGHSASRWSRRVRWRSAFFAQSYRSRTASDHILAGSLPLALNDAWPAGEIVRAYHRASRVLPTRTEGGAARRHAATFDELVPRARTFGPTRLRALHQTEAGLLARCGGADANVPIDSSRACSAASVRRTHRLPSFALLCDPRSRRRVKRGSFPVAVAIWSPFAARPFPLTAQRSAI